MHLQDLEASLDDSQADLEASQKAAEAAEGALQQQVTENKRLSAALERQSGEVAELEGRHEQLAAEAQAHQAESCRSECS